MILLPISASSIAWNDRYEPQDTAIVYDVVSITTSLGCPETAILPILVSQVDKITCVSQQHPA
jgi:hypothetical protein